MMRSNAPTTTIPNADTEIDLPLGRPESDRLGGKRCRAQ